MAKKLTDIYEALKKEGGLAMTMRLAMMTSMSGPQAAMAPDSPETVKKFANAYKEITGKDCPIK